MWKETTKNNIIAFILFVLGKIFAFAGVALGFESSFRVVGGTLLGLSGILLIASVLLCVKEMNRQTKVEEELKIKKDKEKSLIENMIEDGSVFKILNSAGYKVCLK